MLMRAIQWIADHIGNVFWARCGAGAGATSVVYLGAVSTSPEVLRTGFATLAAILGAAGALLASRHMDRMNDDRSRRRKAYLVALTVRGLQFHAEQFSVMVDAIEELGGLHGGSKPRHAVDRATMLLVRANRLRLAAAASPDFDDLLDTAADARMALAIREAFIQFAEFYRWIDLEDLIQDDEKLIVAGQRLEIKRNNSGTMKLLSDGRAHFEAKAGEAL